MWILECTSRDPVSSWTARAFRRIPTEVSCCTPRWESAVTDALTSQHLGHAPSSALQGVHSELWVLNPNPTCNPLSFNVFRTLASGLLTACGVASGPAQTTSDTAGSSPNYETRTMSLEEPG